MSATTTGRPTAPSVNPYLLRSSLVAALGGLLFGLDTPVIAGTTRPLRELFSLSPAMLGITVSSASFGSSEWRWKFGMVSIPAAAFFFALFGIPQSPRWLVAVGRAEEARKVLQRVGEPNPDRELEEIAESLTNQRGIQREPLF